MFCPTWAFPRFAVGCHLFTSYMRCITHLDHLVADFLPTLLSPWLASAFPDDETHWFPMECTATFPNPGKPPPVFHSCFLCYGDVSLVTCEDCSLWLKPLRRVPSLWSPLLPRYILVRHCDFASAFVCLPFSACVVWPVWDTTCSWVHCSHLQHE